MIKKYMWFLVIVFTISLILLPIHILAATELDSPAENLSASITGTTNTFGNAYSGSASTGIVTLKVSSLRSAMNGTLTLTNCGEDSAVLSFSYTVSGDYSSCTIDGNAVSGSGTYNAELASGASLKIYLAGNAWESAEVKLNNVALVLTSAANLTISHNGVGTVSIGGTVTDSGSTVEIAKEGTTLVATPASDAKFLGWINTADNSVVSTAASFTYVPTGNASIKAIFASATTEACFWGSAKAYLFEDLSAAISHATSASNKTIILASNGTLFSGEYTIPSGVILLTPFDSESTIYTTSPGYVKDSYTKPSAYSTLTLDDGANITVESGGAISVSAKVSAKMGYAGAPTSKYGHIAMNEGSSITVQSGGNLYAWGFISGSGTVNLKSGATAYESFQVVDWRGGTASSGMLGNSNKVFPMTQYYVQNVEAPMVLETGATVTCSMIADIISVRQVTVQFLGTSGCIFNLSSGSVTKQYDGSKDRLVLDINGTFSISSTEIKLLGDLYKIKLSDYVLPINNNVTINVNSGTLKLDQDISLLPGAQINIAEDSIVQLSSGKRLCVYDETEWKSGYYVYSSAYFRPVNYAHSKAYTRANDTDIVDAKILVNGTLDASAGYLYTTASEDNSGANICSTGSGVVKVQTAESSPTLYEATQSGTSISYASISVGAAKLKHADGTYLDTDAGDYYYNNDHGKWVLDGHDITSVDKEPTCTEKGYTTHTCSCGYSYTNNEVEATGHDYTNSVVSYNWTDDYTACTASHSCTVCGHTETATATSTSEITVATCTTDGKIVYTATFTGGWAETQTQTIVLTAKGHDYVEHVCSGCGITDLIQLVGRTLKYVDTINVICLFEFSSDAAVVKDDGGKITNAGIVVWETKPTVDSLMNGSAPSGNTEVVDSLKTYPDNASYYYAEASGITASNLHKSAYYAGYIVDGDGKYLYSEVFEYSPSIYAYNMLAKETGTEEHQAKQETQDLCVALLNYISAAQQYFGYDEVNDTTVDADELVNKDLSDDQKIVPSSLELNLTQIAEIGTSDSLFTRVGKNLYFNDRVNLAAMFEFEDESADISKSGTIFWTSSQWEALGYTSENMPNKDSHGGTSAALELYSGSVYASICPINIAPKDMKDTKIYSMGYVYTGNVDNDEYVYSSVKAYGIEDYISLIINMETTEGSKETYMQLLAKRLYQYERATNAALLNS